MTYPIMIRTAMAAPGEKLTEVERYSREMVKNGTDMPIDVEILEDASFRLEMTIGNA